MVDLLRGELELINHSFINFQLLSILGALSEFYNLSHFQNLLLKIVFVLFPPEVAFFVENVQPMNVVYLPTILIMPSTIRRFYRISSFPHFEFKVLENILFQFCNFKYLIFLI